MARIKRGVRRSGFWRVGLLEAKARYLILLLLLLGTEVSFLLSVFYSVSQVCASGVWKPVTVRRGSRLLCNRLRDVRVLAMRCTSLTSTGANGTRMHFFGWSVHSLVHTHSHGEVRVWRLSASGSLHAPYLISRFGRVLDDEVAMSPNFPTQQFPRFNSQCSLCSLPVATPA